MRSAIFYAVALSLIVVGFVLFGLTFKAEAGGVWNDQYCNAKTETIITKDSEGKIINKETVETMVCDDGAKDFLAYSGIAKECREYWFDMYVNQQWIRKKGYACKKFDGSWEMVNPQQ